MALDFLEALAGAGIIGALIGDTGLSFITTTPIYPTATPLFIAATFIGAAPTLPVAVSRTDLHHEVHRSACTQGRSAVSITEVRQEASRPVDVRVLEAGDSTVADSMAAADFMEAVVTGN